MANKGDSALAATTLAQPGKHAAGDGLTDFDLTGASRTHCAIRPSSLSSADTDSYKVSSIGNLVVVSPN